VELHALLAQLKIPVTLVKTLTVKIVLRLNVPNVKPISTRTLKEFVLNVEKIAMHVLRLLNAQSVAKVGSLIRLVLVFYVTQTAKNVV